MVPVNRYEPMLAKLCDKPFDSVDYIYEPKLDGIRCIAYVTHTGVTLINRSGNDVTTKFPEIRIRLKAGYTSAVLDGELVCLTEEGVPDFQCMQTRMNRKHAIAQAMSDNPATLVCFDILEVNGKDICNNPLYNRKVVLDRVVQETPTCLINDYRTAYGTMWLAELTAKGWEGIMAKLINGRYHPGKRGPEWLKMKARKDLIVYVGAVTQGQGRRENSFGALMVGTRPTPYSSKLAFMGEVGTGFTDEDLEYVLGRLSALETEQSPFIHEPPGQVMFYVKPKLQVAVTYLELTNDNIMRHAAFKGVASA